MAADFLPYRYQPLAIATMRLLTTPVWLGRNHVEAMEFGLPMFSSDVDELLHNLNGIFELRRLWKASTTFGAGVDMYIFGDID